jgi:hypothetical protein
MSILGARDLVHILTGQTVPVKVDISCQKFDFGQVRVGQVCEADFAITNRTACTVDLEVNLDKAPDFAVVDSATGRRLGMLNAKSAIYILRLNAKATAHLKLSFCPTQVAAYDLTVPVQVNAQGFTTLHLRSTVLQAPIRLVGGPRVNFGVLPGASAPASPNGDAADMATAGSIMRTLKVVNVTQQSVTLKLDTLPLGGTPFGIHEGPSLKVLEEAARAFTIEGGGTYELEFWATTESPLQETCIVGLPLFVESELRPFAHVELHAARLVAELCVDQPLLDFGCVSIGNVRTLRAMLSFSSPQELATRVSFSSSVPLATTPIAVGLPSGSMLGASSLPVEVSIKSSVAASVDVSITFTTAAGHETCMRVLGIVDNSVMSIISEPTYDLDMAEISLRRFLQLFAFPQPAPVSFPSTFFERCGWPLADIITFLSGHSIPSLPLTRPETLNHEQQRTILVTTLQYLAGKGALLAHVDVNGLWSSDAPKARRAWIILLAQVVRVFTLARWPVPRQLAQYSATLVPAAEMPYSKVRGGEVEKRSFGSGTAGQHFSARTPLNASTS